MDEKKAIAMLKSGDISGLRILVELYQDKAVKISALITGDPEDAKDIVQNGFLKVYEKIHLFDSNRSFSPWFFRIVTNDSLKAINRKNRKMSIDNDFGVIYEIFPNTDKLPEKIVENNQTKRCLWNALSELSPKQRTVIVYRYFLGMKQSEIAKALRSPLGTVKWRLHRARSQLEKLLSDV